MSQDTTQTVAAQPETVTPELLAAREAIRVAREAMKQAAISGDEEAQDKAVIDLQKAKGEEKAQLAAIAKAKTDLLIEQARKAKVAIVEDYAESLVAIRMANFIAGLNPKALPAKPTVEDIAKLDADYSAKRQLAYNQATGNVSVPKAASTTTGEAGTRGATGKEIADYVAGIYASNPAFKGTDVTAFARKDVGLANPAKGVEGKFNDGTFAAAAKTAWIALGGTWA